MNVPNEIKAAVKELADVMRRQIGPRDNSKIHDEAMRLLREIWDVREQIPAPEHSADEYFTPKKLEFAHVVQDWQAEQEVLWGGRLIGLAVDRYLYGVSLWNFHVNQEPVDTSWVDPIADKVVKKLWLNPRNLRVLMRREELEMNMVKLEVTPMEGSRVFKEAVEDLTAEQKQALANLLQWQGLPENTTEGIFKCLYIDITKCSAYDFADLGAMAGLFYAVWNKLRSMES